MPIARPFALVAALSAPTLVQAQEAFVTQIDSFVATVTIPAQPTGDAIRQTITRLTPSVPGTGGQSATIDVDRFSSGEFRLIELTRGGALADIRSDGDGNTAVIDQTGENAASIRQDGNGLSAAITQSGARNRASIYQSGARHSAVVRQAGTGNRALVIQR